MQQPVTEDLVSPGGILIPPGAIAWRFSRGTGPGGQGVNTTDSRVELVVDLTALVAAAGVADRVRGVLGDSLRIVVASERSQLRNRQTALHRLVERIDRAAEPGRPRTRTLPTHGSVKSRLASKRLDGQRKARRRDPQEDPQDTC